MRGGDCASSRMEQFKALLILTVLSLALLILTGCATPSRGALRIAPRFYGTWTNVDARYYNWWEISAKRVINYGIALDGGKCAGREATIVASDTITVPFGNSGTVHMDIVDNQLIFTSLRGVGRHRRVSRESICQRGDGTYFDAAPYASLSK